MFRNIMNDLATWYEIGENKAALIRGGKFVGKTWAALDFATGFLTNTFLSIWSSIRIFASIFQRSESLRSFMRN